MKNKIVIFAAFWFLLQAIPWPGLPHLLTFLNYNSGIAQLTPPDRKMFDSEDRILTNKKYKGTVFVDSNRIPHIYAEDNASSSYFLGYLHAKNRLFQMELISRMVQGRLGEIISNKNLLEVDQYWRSFDFDRSVYLETEKMKKTNPKVYERLQAYADGVNAYLGSMRYSELPPEYMLLNFSPRQWKPYYSVLLVKYMADMLSSSSYDLLFQDLANVLPKEIIQTFYPQEEKYLQSTIPEKTGTVDRNSIKENYKSGEKLTFALNKAEQEKYEEQKIIGSNNWIVSGKKSKSGESILANDMHLALNLPSPWYEVHIKTPEFHVYGLSIPSAPFVVAGTNEAVSWGMTNATWDLTDFFEVDYANEEKTKIWFGKEQVDITFIPDTIKRKGFDNFIYTKKLTEVGPIRVIKGKEYLHRWTAAEHSVEAKVFMNFETISSWEHFIATLKEHKAPPQNFIFADTAGNIGTYTAGLMPRKNKGFERGIFKSSNELAATKDFLSFEETPHIYNPEKGFIATANQRQLTKNGNYFNWDFADPYRGYRISQMLAENEKHTVQSLKDIQADVVDHSFFHLKEFILKSLEKETDIQKMFSSWDGAMKAESSEALIFENFKFHFLKKINGKIRKNIDSIYTGQDWVRISYLMEHENFELFGEKINRQEFFNEIMEKSLAELRIDFGNDIMNWKYGDKHQTQFRHLLRLAPFSPKKMKTGGSKFTVNVAHGFNVTSGASQRNVYHMTTPVNVFTSVAGGQSGRPSSQFYTNRLENWKKVKHLKGQFVSDPKDLKNIAFTIKTGEK
jgi:penicillin amidase